MITDEMVKRFIECNNKGHRMHGDVHNVYGLRVHCKTCGAIIAWHIPDTRKLPKELDYNLFVTLPAGYEEDSEFVDRALWRLGFQEVTSANYKDAFEEVKNELEKLGEQNE